MVWSIIIISDLMARTVHRVLTSVAGEHMKEGGNNREIDTAHVLYAMALKDVSAMWHGKCLYWRRRYSSVLAWGRMLQRLLQR